VTPSHCWDNGDGTGGCVVTGSYPPSGGGGGGGGGGGDGATEVEDRFGGDSDDPPIIVCALGNGDVGMTFDGRPIHVRAKYQLRGPGAAESAAYIEGIMNIWTVDFPDQGIGIRTELLPDPNGFVIYVDDQYHGYEGLTWPAGTQNWEIRLGSLAGIVEPTFSFKMRVAGHEFGHFWFTANLPPTATNPSIMADAQQGTVLPSDLRAMVEACRAAGS
jgi:hypothetical protein